MCEIIVLLALQPIGKRLLIQIFSLRVLFFLLGDHSQIVFADRHPLKFIRTTPWIQDLVINI